MTALTAWQNFYVIVGSSAGALIGLQFVVLTLIDARPVREGQAQAGSAFATPTIVHFGTVLLLAAVLNVPWQAIAAVAVLLGLIGLAGIIYVTIVARRMRTQNAYQPEFEDWLFHLLLPFAAYAAMAAAAFETCWNVHHALFAVATATLCLLFIGIHNAWDSITFQVFVKRKPGPESERASAKEMP